MGLLRADGSDIVKLQAGLLAMKKGMKVTSDHYLGLLADFLRDSIREELDGNGQDKYGFYWHGKLLNSIRKKKVSAVEIDIVQDEEGLFTLYGTKPHPQATHPPYGLVDWAQSKLGLSMSAAYPVALSIFRKGTLSPQARYHYPGGARGFNYAEFVVENKERKTIEDFAEKISSIVVQYLKI